MLTLLLEYGCIHSYFRKTNSNGCIEENNSNFRWMIASKCKTVQRGFDTNGD